MVSVFDSVINKFLLFLTAAHSKLMDGEVQEVKFEELYLLLSELESYNLYAVVFSSDGFDEWCLAPARFVFQLFGDQTIFFCVPNDLHVEFDFTDWLDWMHNEEYRVSAGYTKLSWHRFINWMRNETNAWLNLGDCRLFAVPSDVDTEAWRLYRRWVRTELGVSYAVDVPWK